MSDGGPTRNTPDATPLFGLHIRFKRLIDRPCTCGRTDIVIGQGAGPHAAAVHCAGCGRNRSWLAKAAVDFLLAMIERFGRPTEPITIRSFDYVQANPGETSPTLH